MYTSKYSGKLRLCFVSIIWFIRSKMKWLFWNNLNNLNTSWYQPLDGREFNPTSKALKVFYFMIRKVKKIQPKSMENESPKSAWWTPPSHLSRLSFSRLPFCKLPASSRQSLALPQTGFLNVLWTVWNCITSFRSPLRLGTCPTHLWLLFLPYPWETDPRTFVAVDWGHKISA